MPMPNGVAERRTIPPARGKRVRIAQRQNFRSAGGTGGIRGISSEELYLPRGNAGVFNGLLHGARNCSTPRRVAVDADRRSADLKFSSSSGDNDTPFRDAESLPCRQQRVGDERTGDLPGKKSSVLLVLPVGARL